MILEWMFVDYFSALSRGHGLTQHKLTASSITYGHYHQPVARKPFEQAFTLEKIKKDKHKNKENVQK